MQNIGHFAAGMTKGLTARWPSNPNDDASFVIPPGQK